MRHFMWFLALYNVLKHFAIYHTVSIAPAIVYVIFALLFELWHFITKWALFDGK